MIGAGGELNGHCSARSAALISWKLSAISSQGSGKIDDLLYCLNHRFNCRCIQQSLSRFRFFIRLLRNGPCFSLQNCKVPATLSVLYKRCMVKAISGQHIEHTFGAILIVQITRFLISAQAYVLRVQGAQNGWLHDYSTVGDLTQEEGSRYSRCKISQNFPIRTEGRIWVRGTEHNSGIAIRTIIRAMQKI